MVFIAQSTAMGLHYIRANGGGEGEGRRRRMRKKEKRGKRERERDCPMSVFCSMQFIQLLFTDL